MRTSYLTSGLLSLSLGLLTTTAWASGEHNSSHGTMDSADIDRTIQLDAGDMWFDRDNMQIKAGETLKFEVTNTGNLEHEFVLGDPAAQTAHREMMQKMSGNGEHGSHGGHDMAEGEHGGQMPTMTIAPGETATLVWTAPDNVEHLEYACNIPGHYESGMSGDINLI